MAFWDKHDSEDFDADSLELIYGQICVTLRSTFEKRKGLDSKAGIILSAIAVVIVVLFDIAIRLKFPPAETIFMVLFATLTLVSGVVAFSTESYVSWPHPRKLYCQYKSKSADETKAYLSQEFVWAVEINDDLLERKASWLQGAIYALLATVLFVGGLICDARGLVNAAIYALGVAVAIIIGLCIYKCSIKKEVHRRYEQRRRQRK